MSDKANDQERLADTAQPKDTKMEKVNQSPENKIKDPASIDMQEGDMNNGTTGGDSETDKENSNR